MLNSQPRRLRTTTGLALEIRQVAGTMLIIAALGQRAWQIWAATI
ncbi:hypothetical protein [Methylobacterium sp. NEAU K]|nr:hypothetical protein [Methylobacterium sp. NEAU K]